LAKVTLMPPFAGEFFGGKAEQEAEGANLFRLIEALDVLGPGFAEAAQTRAAFGVDGAVRADWSQALAADARVTVFPRVAGG
jgi:molybdopterin converting factor small subunit